MLEVGAAKAWAAPFWRERDCEYVATDILVDPKIGLGRGAFYGDFGRVQADGENLPFADATFDVTYCCATLHHALDLPRMVSRDGARHQPGGVVAGLNEGIRGVFREPRTPTRPARRRSASTSTSTPSGRMPRRSAGRARVRRIERAEGWPPVPWGGLLSRIPKVGLTPAPSSTSRRPPMPAFRSMPESPPEPATGDRRSRARAAPGAGAGRRNGIAIGVGLGALVLTFYLVEASLQALALALHRRARVEPALALDRGHRRTRPGAASPHFFESLYSYLIAPAWWIHSTAAAYTAVKYINAVVMCLTACRPISSRGCSSPAARPRVALLSIAIPAMGYATSIVPESLAYLWFTTAALFAVRLFAAPSVGRRGPRDPARRSAASGSGRSSWRCRRSSCSGRRSSG